MLGIAHDSASSHLLKPKVVIWTLVHPKCSQSGLKECPVCSMQQTQQEERKVM